MACFPWSLLASMRRMTFKHPGISKGHGASTWHQVVSTNHLLGGILIRQGILSCNKTVQKQSDDIFKLCHMDVFKFVSKVSCPGMPLLSWGPFFESWLLPLQKRAWCWKLSLWTPLLGYTGQVNPTIVITIPLCPLEIIDHFVSSEIRNWAKLMPNNATLRNAYRSRKSDGENNCRVPQSFSFFPREGMALMSINEFAMY